MRPNSPHLTLGQACQILNCVPSTIFALCQKEALPPLQKIGNRWVLDKKEFKTYLKQQDEGKSKERWRRSWELSRKENEKIRRNGLTGGPES